MKKKIAVLTATRAEYGLLKPLIKELDKVEEFDVCLAVTGAHLSPEFGLTYKEIDNDGFNIDEKIEILLSSDSPSAISKSMGLAIMGFADYFKRLKPDLLVILGDRYETLAVAIVAMNERIPIAHLYGGETTEGAIDEAIRHAITKLSYLHFTSTETYRNRVVQLGENPKRIFCVGAIGVENIKNEKLLNKDELEASIDFALNKPYALVTFHPVTLEHNQTEKQFQELLMVCETFKDVNFIFSKANSDVEGRTINQLQEIYVNSHDNAVFFDSLGVTRYLSAMKYCAMVIGNSSSGLIEAPSFGVPTINIGDRQKGRIQGDSVINCAPNASEIKDAIHIALTDEFKKKAKSGDNPYGDGNTSKKIVNIIKEFLLENKIELKKKFYDCKVR